MSYAGWAPRWVEPEQLDESGDAGGVLSAAQVAQWRARGYLAVHGLWPAATVARAVAATERAQPAR
jgi:ribonuclease I